MRAEEVWWSGCESEIPEVVPLSGYECACEVRDGACGGVALVCGVAMVVEVEAGMCGGYPTTVKVSGSTRENRAGETSMPRSKT